MNEEHFKRLISTTEPEGSESVLDAIKIYELGLRPETVKGPIGAFMLAGPTGTGKTHYVGALSRALHKDATERYLRINCGEFRMPHEVARLIGAPPGYLGHRETVPLLSAAKLTAKKSGHSSITIVLFDEIEKAHADIQNFFLGLLDTQNGTITMGDGAAVSFKDCLIFFTTNLGSRARKSTYTFEGSERESAHLTAIREHFSPEFLGRLTAVLKFQELSKFQITKIAIAILEEQKEHLQKQGFFVTFDNSILEPVIAEGYNPKYGIRELKRAVERLILVPVARNAQRGSTLTVLEKDGKIVVEVGGGVNDPAPRRRRAITGV